MKFMCNHPSKELLFIKNLSPEEVKKNKGKYRSIWYCNRCHSIVYDSHRKEIDTGNISDGYHTFNELYHHRAILTAVIVHQNKSRCWKSMKHHDGTMYDGMFIVGINTPEGMATYHYDVDPYWFIFDCKELPKAPPFDGHTSSDAINRIGSFLKDNPLTRCTMYSSKESMLNTLKDK